MKASNDDKLLIPLREVVQRLSISERTLWSQSSPRGPIPVVRIGERICATR